MAPKLPPSRYLSFYAACVLLLTLGLAQTVSSQHHDALSPTSDTGDPNSSEFVEDIYSFGVDTREDQRIEVSLRFQNQSQEAWEYTGLQLDELYDRLSSLTDLERLNLEISEARKDYSKYRLTSFGFGPPVKMSYIKIPPLPSLSEVAVVNSQLFSMKGAIPSPYVPVGWLASFSGNLKQLPNLTSLEIEFHTWREGVSNEEVIQFSKTLPELKNLTRLKLLFQSGFKIGDQALAELLGGISQLAQLTSLTLLLDLTEALFLTLTSSFEKLSNLPNLEFLSLTLIGLSADQASQFGPALSTYTRVSSLELIFKDWKVPEPVMNELAKSLASLKNLASLVLIFPSWTVTGAGSLLKSAHNLPNIQSLQFKVNVQGYDSWALQAEISILKGKNQLSFDYNLSLDRFDKQNLASFYLNLPELKNLKRLAVHRDGQPYSTDLKESDATPEALAGSIAKMTFLEELEIRIYAEEPGLIKLARALSSLKQLKSLDIFFYSKKASSLYGYLSDSIRHYLN